MTTLDRMFFISYVRSYLIVLTSLISLYVIVDLFTNLNDFTNNKNGLVDVLKHIVSYYSVQITLIFNVLCEAISLIAAVFAVAWMQRNNELLPQLSAGVPTHRAVRPILLGAGLTACLGPINSEFVIPQVADRLTVPRDDPEMRKPAQVRGGFDSITNDHITGGAAFRRELKVMRFEYASNPESVGGLIHLLATEAVYIPANSPDAYRGGWMLYNTTPEKLNDDKLPENLKAVMPGRYFLKLPDTDFDAVTRRANWYLFAPTHQLWNMLERPDTGRQTAVAVLFHSRLTRPIVSFIMVILGLAVILRDQNRHVFISTGMCLIMCALFYAVVYGCKFLGEVEYLPATMSAWLPVVIFGPLAFSLFDAVHT